MLSRNEWSRDKLRAFQRERLQSILRHAVQASPYYRETLGDLVARRTAFGEYPILTKRALMQNFDRIVTDPRLSRGAVDDHLSGEHPGAAMFGEYRVAATGGTSGERGFAVFDQEGWLSAIANTLRFQKMVGIDEDTNSMGIFASSPVHISHRIGAEIRALRPSAPRLNVLMPLSEVVSGLNTYQPQVISTYPSYVKVLANEQLAGRLHIKPRLIRTSAETLTEDVRRLAAKAWGAVIANSYTCTEAGAMGHECELANGLHLAEDAFVFEVVDANGRPVPNGTRGAKLLVTSLTNRVLPLVRYEISDVVTLATEPCRCGLPFWRIASIDGRAEEMLRFGSVDGGMVEVHAHRLRSPLTATPGVRQYQFAQLPDGLEITISLFPETDPDVVGESIRRSVDAELAKVGARAGKLLIRTVDVIMRSGAGAKEKLVVTPTISDT
ncbi:phenylacetate--CoA ligase family protein [Rhizobium sp. RHZ02]|nr:phenylacetate--CoA ligase family protein [Rhizobium sp. RHZ02]